MASFFDVASTAKGWKVILKCKLLSSSCIHPPPEQDFGAIRLPPFIPPHHFLVSTQSDCSFIIYATSGGNTTKSIDI